MKDSLNSLGYTPAPGVTWLVQRRGVLLLDDFARRAVSLAYPEAVVWELLAEGRSPDGAAVLLALILATTEEEARGQVERCRRVWCEAGWLTPAQGAIRE